MLQRPWNEGGTNASTAAQREREVWRRVIEEARDRCADRRGVAWTGLLESSTIVAPPSDWFRIQIGANYTFKDVLREHPPPMESYFSSCLDCCSCKPDEGMKRIEDRSHVCEQ